MLKNVRLGDTLINKLHSAREGLQSTRQAYNDLTARFEPSQVGEWLEAEAEAQRTRGNALKIYDIAVGNGRSSFTCYQTTLKMHQTLG